MITTFVPGQGVGSYGWFFVKRQTPSEYHIAVLQALAISDQSTPSLDAYNASILAETRPPPRAPTITWALYPEVSQQEVANLVEKMGLQYPVAAPHEDAEAAGAANDEDGLNAGAAASEEEADEDVVHHAEVAAAELADEAEAGFG